jgi:hypothetical protein
MVRFYEHRGYVCQVGARTCVVSGCGAPQYQQPGGKVQSRCKRHYAEYQLARYHAKKQAVTPDATESAGEDGLE